METDLSSESEEFSTVHPQYFYFEDAKPQIAKCESLKRGMKWYQHFGFHMFVSGSIALVIAACVINFHRAIGLLVIASLTVFFLVWDWIMERYGDRMWEAAYPVRQFLSRNWFWMRWWEIWCLFNLYIFLQSLWSEGVPLKVPAYSLLEKWSREQIRT